MIVARLLFGLAPPEFAYFAERRTELNEVLWPALLSFGIVSKQHAEVPKEKLIELLDPEERDLLQFDSRGVFTLKGRQLFSRAICRLVVVSIAPEFETFVERYWKRIHLDPKLSSYNRSALFNPAQVGNILKLVSTGASKANLLRACFATELANATSRFLPTYVTDLVTWQTYFREIRNCIVHNDGLADNRLTNAASTLQSLAVESSAYWPKHGFDVHYYALGEEIELTPYTTIATVYYLNEFATMLASHLMAGRWGDVVFDERIDAALSRAANWIDDREISSQKRLNDPAFVERRLNTEFSREGLSPARLKSCGVFAALFPALRARTKY